MKHLIFYHFCVVEIVVSLCAIGAAFSASKHRIRTLQDDALYNQAWQAVLQRIEGSAQNLEDEHFPMLANNITGEWVTFETPRWTGGFWVGMLWLAFDKTREAKYLQWARTWNDAVLGFEEEENHDRGFVYFYSSVFGYKLIQEERYLQSAFKAARELVAMFQPNSKVIPQNLKQPENVIIDTMMNLQLLWWAYANAEDSDPFKNSYRKVAISHTQTTLEDFIREDGSTWQSVHYDTATGKILKKHTHQGLADSSCWSRGQSWGFYGFLKAFEATLNPDFLTAAKILADYIMTHLPDDGVPWYDYDDPGEYKDTSAGAIAASAFLQFAQLVKDPADQVKYENMGKHLLQALITRHMTPFIGKDSPPGILRNGCYQIFKNADSETIWGDYFLMEALAQVVFTN